jgi:hypothetical protein
VAPQVIFGQYLSLGGTDYSEWLTKATLEVQATKQESTTMTASGWETSEKGLRSGNLGLEFVDSFTTAELDALLWGLFSGSISTAFELRQTQAAVGVSNPKWTGSVQVLEYKAGAGVGELAKKSLTIPTTGLVNRLTS